MDRRHSSTVTVGGDQLPLWPDDLRGLPNAFARSALFTVANLRAGDERRYLPGVLIAAQPGVEIRYTGPQLRQDDEDVFLQVLHLSRKGGIRERVRFTAYSMLTELHWTKNSASYARLDTCLTRLSATDLKVRVQVAPDRFQTFDGSLVRKFFSDERQDEISGEWLTDWEVLMEPEVIKLFAPNLYTLQHWRQRLRLKSPMAKWLHSFYSTHREPFPLSVAKLYELMGSEMKNRRAFKTKLREALESLVEREFLASARIDGTDMVWVERLRRPGAPT